MGIQVLDHYFVDHKSSEMICWQCGYVIWRCDTHEQIVNAIHSLSGEYLACGNGWHKQVVVIPTYSLWLSKAGNSSQLLAEK